MTEQWHYIITLTWSVAANHSTTFTAEGRIDIEPGATRRDTYHKVVRAMREVESIPDHAAIVTQFFSLEPNLLIQSSPLRADSAPRSGAACPDPLDGDAGGSGHASNLP
ncbi:hypothetical protein [Nocardia farcinica]|uniref:hypothetical protein n=1 Tax=Nocardia farcinica TaxID=37329 RepID=UPI001893B0BA|nr:hypothetical protein [Nocardia farcinica]MBF6411003.1 hypothetical protein [Nocardia farcinica]